MIHNTVEVIYYSSTGHIHRQLITMENAMTYEACIRASQILDACDEIELQSCIVGVFSKVVSLKEQAQPGDRIEIYRKLTLTPMERRRLLATKQKSKT